MHHKIVTKLWLILALHAILAAPVFAEINTKDVRQLLNISKSENERGIDESRWITRFFDLRDQFSQRNRQNSDRLPNMLESENAHGFDATYSTAGFIDLTNPFFQSLGSNGRSCVTCHVPSEGWTITPKGVQKLFEETDGLDPLFRLVDGANSPLESVATVDERRNAYSMLLNKANIRTGIGIPDDAEFELIEVDDPYGYASEEELSLYRRPLPTTNLKFLNAIMWEGRDTTLDESSGDCIFGTQTCFTPVSADLAAQANHATLGHAEALQELTAEEQEAIVAFESSLFTAQVFDKKAGKLTANRAKGGPIILEKVEYYFGINDTVDGDYRSGESFNPIAMTLFDTWKRHEPTARRNNGAAHARAAIARGQDLFNSKPILISGVSGLNDELGIPEIPGSCTTCHNIPNAGNHSVPLPLDIGISDTSRRTPDMPLYTLRNIVTGEEIETTDPGRALITGKWKDIGRFKGPILRSVASRPPYFHDGSAADLHEVVEFYNTRFSINLTDQEKSDLVSFLGAL